MGPAVRWHVNAALASRLNLAEAKIAQLRLLHKADALGSCCVHCGEGQEWPCASFQILDGSS